MLTIAKIYPSKVSKALCESFHESVAMAIKEHNLDQENDFREILPRYRQQIDVMQRLVSYSRSLDTTPEVTNAMNEVDKALRRLYGNFRALKFGLHAVEEEEYAKLENEIMRAFPLTLLRSSWPNRIGLLNVLITHLKNDWTPLLVKTGLTDDFQNFENQVRNLEQAIIGRSEERASIEKGHAKRMMSDLFDSYFLICLYIEAWSNTESEDPALKSRQQRAMEALCQINEIIENILHGLAVARSNRRRAKKVKDHFTISDTE